MKIRTKLILLSVVFVALAVAIAATMFLTFIQVKKEVDSARNASKIMKHIFELNAVTYEYLMHHEKRMAHQWNLKYNSLGKMLSDRILEKQKKGYQEELSVLKSIDLDYQALRGLFSSLQAIFLKRMTLIKEKESKQDIDLTFALEERLAAQLLIRGQKIVTEAYKLSVLTEIKINRMEQQSNQIVILCIVGFVALLSYVSFFGIRDITRPIHQLVKGAEEFGRGNLDVRVETKSKDEIGTLAITFNQMAEKRQNAEEERKQVGEALRESESQVRLLLDSTAEAIYGLDMRGNCIFANSACLQFLGYETTDDLIGKNMHKLIHHTRPDDSPYPEEECLIYKAFKKGEGTHVDDEVLWRADGTSFWAEYWSYPVHRDNQITGSVVTFLNINDRKKAEEDLRLAHEKLVRQEKLSVLGQLSGGVGHELRNPLGVISNAVYYLKMVQPDADEKIKEYLETISVEVRRSTKIVADLLDLSRTKQADREPIAVSDLTKQVLDRCRPPENVKVITQFASDLLSLYVDPRQIDQVFSNLITNAYQAMPDGGELTIEARAEQNKARVSVTDTGYGISKENLEKVFEPLFTTKARGIGLGLVVSKSLVEANGGTIEVKSEKNKGSTFTLILPFREAIT